MAGRTSAWISVLTTPGRLGWWRRAALGVLWAEYAAAGLWAAVSVLAAAAGLALLGVVPAGTTGPTILLALTAAGLALALTAAWRRAPSRPTAARAERRLERDSALPHRPFAVLRDTPAGPASPLWAQHRARAEAALRRLRLAGPTPGLPQQDPAALRALAALLLLSGIVVAGADAPARLAAAFIPAWPAAGGAPAITLQAWIEPPAYTGLAPVFLPRNGGALSVPEGSRLNISISGGGLTPHLRFSPDAGPAAARPGKLRKLAENSWQSSGVLRQSGTLRITRFWGTLAAWQLDILPNTPPAVAWTATPTRAGSSLEIRLPWHAAQRWGVAALNARLVPAANPALPPIRLPITLPGTPKDASGALQTDLSADPYAGVDMIGTLEARDVSGQTGTSAPARFTLPARTFHNGLARALIDLRRRLALRQETAQDAASDLDALTEAPKNFSGHSGLYLNLAAIAPALRDNPSPAGLADAQQRLWTVALALDGALPEPTQAALDRARDALRKAIEDRRAGRAPQSELDKQIAKLREALQNRINDMAQKAVRDGKLPPFDPRAQHFRMPSLDRMLKELQQAMQQGRQQDAEQKLAQIENLLNKLQQAKILSPQEQQEAERQNRNAKRQQGAVQDMVQREAGLMDNAQKRAPRPAPIPLPQLMMPWGGTAPDLQMPPDPDQMEANEEAREKDSTTQRALSRALDALKDAFAQSGGKVPPNMDAAGRAMGEAVDALKNGQEGVARSAEARAVAELQKGGQSMSKQMAANSQMAIVPGGAEPGDEDEDAGMGGGEQQGGQRDPLGRPFKQGQGGRAVDDSSVRVPDQMEQLRSRAIQEELRRRGADRERRREELDYIDRLLKPF